jgi:hypothetical protein
MDYHLAHRLQLLPLVILFICACQPVAQADPIPVRYTRGTIHGLLELRAEDGHVVASGDLVQVAHGSQVTAQLTFHFKDGSIDDETTVFSQRGTFKLITDHHLQKGPSFPQPIDLFIDCRSGKVIIGSTGKDGKEEVKTSQLHLPPDLANGLVSAIIENIRPGTAETRVSMLAATPSARLVTLSISSRGEDTFSVAGAVRKANHYEIKIELGGIAGVVAPLIGKQPPSAQVWTIGGQAPTFIKEQGQLYQDSPMFTIELTGPTWSDPPSPGK